MAFSATSADDRSWTPQTPNDLDDLDGPVHEPVILEGPDADEPGARSLFSRANAWLREITLPQLMRFVGSLVIVASALAFMVQSWSGGDVLSRYLHFLGFTGVLCGAGFFCGIHNRDDKGARSFLALVSASVPAHFVVLSAIVFSHLAASMEIWTLTFAPPPWTATLMTVGLGLSAVAAMTWIAMRALARGEAKRLGFVYFMTNLALMIPVRDANIVALLAAIGGAGLFAYDRKVLSPIPALRTVEGYWLRAMMAVPFGLMIFRSVFYYGSTDLMDAFGGAAAAALLFGFSAQCRARRWVAAPLELASIFSALVSTLSLVELADEIARIPDAYWPPALLIPTAALLFGASLTNAVGSAWYRRGAAVVATAGMLAGLLLESNIVNAMLTLTTSSAVMIHGFKMRERIPFGLGALGMGWSILYQLQFAFFAVNLSGWVPLAVIGVTVMLAASYCEKNQREIKARATALRKQLSDWDV